MSIIADIVGRLPPAIGDPQFAGLVTLRRDPGAEGCTFPDPVIEPRLNACVA